VVNRYDYDNACLPVVQIIILFQNYIKEYYLKSTGFSIQNNNTFSKVSP
jgi:hypothetical protein